MSHEVVQVIKLVKYNRNPHDMIRVTCKRIPTTVNKKIHKNEHSHEMTQFQNQIVTYRSQGYGDVMATYIREVKTHSRVR